jgi:hypothetical protein
MKWIVGAGGRRLIAVGRVGADAAIWTSPDAVNWQRASPDRNGDLAKATHLNGVVARGATVIAVGHTSKLTSRCGTRKWSEAVVFRSTDRGRTWHMQSSSEFQPRGQEALDVVTFAGRFVALGYEHIGCDPIKDSVAAAWTSADGRAWTSAPRAPFHRPDSELNRGAVIGGVLFAVGDGPTRSTTSSGAKDEHDAEIWAGIPVRK